jgi:hypothetical protein
MSRPPTATVFAARSIAVTGCPVSKATPCSSYQARGLMTMSSTPFSPANTEDSMMRL